MLNTAGGLQPPCGSHKTAGYERSSVTGGHNALFPDLMEIAFLRCEETGTHLGAISTQNQGGGKGLAVAESAGAAYKRVFVRYGFHNGGQQDHGMDRLPGGMETTFMARGNDHVNARLLATLRGLNGGNNVHPGET